MESRSMDELKRGYRLAVIIAVSMIASLLAYGAVVEILKREYAPFEGFSPFPEVEFLRYALFGIAIAEFFLIRFIRNLILSQRVPVKTASSQGNISSPAIQRLYTETVITCALCESVAIYGLVLFLIAGSSADFYTFLVLSLIYFAVYFPRYDQWERWIKEGERKRIFNQ